LIKLIIVNAKKLEKVLFLLGFEFKRQKGSHAFYVHPDGRRTTIPHHNKDLSRPLIRTILKEINLSIDEFYKMINEI
jgi:predicted RNA binding protein YcfA (HicA-like mRNA interferase family)